MKAWLYLNAPLMPVVLLLGSYFGSRNFLEVRCSYLVRQQLTRSSVPLQIFYDLVRQINRKTPVEKKKPKKKSTCVLL